MGERLGADQVADRVDLRVRGALVLVDLDLAVLGSARPPASSRPEALDVGGAAAGDAEVVDLGRLVAVGDLDRALARPRRSRPGCRSRSSMPCFLKARSTTRAMSLSSAGRIWSSISISITSVPKRRVGGGDLRAGGAGADHGDLLRLLGQRPGAPGVEHAVAELDARDRQRDRAGGEDDLAGLVDVVADLDVAVGVERALALDHGHLVLLPEHLHAVGERFGDRGAALAERLPVDRGVLDDEAQLGAVAGVVVELGGVEDGLGRDAGVVEAAPAGLVALDDGGLLARAGRRGSRRRSRRGRRRSRSRRRNQPWLEPIEGALVRSGCARASGSGPSP